MTIGDCVVTGGLGTVVTFKNIETVDITTSTTGESDTFAGTALPSYWDDTTRVRNINITGTMDNRDAYASPAAFLSDLSLLQRPCDVLTTMVIHWADSGGSDVTTTYQGVILEIKVGHKGGVPSLMTYTISMLETDWITSFS